jgi:hypothetical protein
MSARPPRARASVSKVEVLAAREGFVKFLLSPIGLILIAAILLVLFMPRRAPDKLKKFGKPMRAFHDEPGESDSDGPPKDTDAPLGGSDAGGASRPPDRGDPGSRT